MGRVPLRRQTKILNYLQDVPEVSVAELVRLTGASVATIRRDLLDMEKNGLLVRTFGGARCAVQQSLVMRTFEHRSMLQHDEKLAIAAAAADLIKPGMTIVIDSGTTCWHFSAQLKLKEITPLRIITSALAVIETLGGTEGVEIHLVGGLFRISNLDFCGALSASMFSNFRADAAILGCDSFLPRDGAFSQDMDSAAISQAMVQCADKRILLCDHSKFNQKGCYRILPLQEIHYVVTNQPDKAFKNAPYEVIIAESSQDTE
ncbi:MAG TPA: DeoR/GlpR family DNA-binding transcription regulator [Lentisphaeria bacterium]|nr:DeoR/GlpR family DNA-binding transcription regulator [Lentisphaeria bacterium]